MNFLTQSSIKSFFVYLFRSQSINDVWDVLEKSFGDYKLTQLRQNPDMIDEPQQEIERADEPEPRKEQELEQKLQETVSDEYERIVGIGNCQFTVLYIYFC